MTMRSTSKIQSAKNKASGLNESIDKRVIAWLEKNRQGTCMMIADSIDVAASTCSGVIKPMKESKDGLPAIIEELPNKKPCNVTGNTAIWLRLKPRQLSLIGSNHG